ncbi:hypothetical protein A3860_33955 [Niastella vici]|uniref:Uncharacterized protein n=1 Tax=Niastella vici TaxID=1703345 RepID=A0A1V9FPU5_9BACT|nr:hypothetical protein [Niastella vici]OQP60385.1 hypothetical protein A3860_33955 [Niastella vici]
MHSFKISPDGYKQVRKKILLLSLPAALIVFFVANISSWLNISSRNTVSLPASFYLTMLIPVLVFIAVIAFGVYRSLARVKKMFDSYELLITDKLISREQLNTPTVSIYLSEVQEIIRHKNGSYIIKGARANDLIMVPKQIENREQLEVVLDQIKPIATKGKAANQLRAQALLNLAALVLMLCVFNFDNKIIVAVAGILCIGLSIFNFIRIQKSKNVDYRTKRIRWINLLALLVVIYFMIFKLTGSTLF